LPADFSRHEVRAIKAHLLSTQLRVSPGLRVAPANEIVNLLTGAVPVKTRNAVVARRFVSGFRIVLRYPGRFSLPDEFYRLDYRRHSQREKAVEVECAGGVLRPDIDMFLQQ